MKTSRFFKSLYCTQVKLMFIHHNICTKTKCFPFSQISWLNGLGNKFAYLDKFRAPYPTMPIFSIVQNFGHCEPFGQPAIIRSLIETNCMKLAYLSNPSHNLYVIVFNLETSHCKFTLFTFECF